MTASFPGSLLCPRMGLAVTSMNCVPAHCPMRMSLAVTIIFSYILFPTRLPADFTNTIRSKFHPGQVRARLGHCWSPRLATQNLTTCNLLPLPGWTKMTHRLLLECHPSLSYTAPLDLSASPNQAPLLSQLIFQPKQ